MTLDARGWKAGPRGRTQVLHGDEISDYRLDKKLGQGATGAVHKAFALRGPLRGRVVAIKIILKASLNTVKRRNRIDCEISLHANLPPHPSIVKFGHSFEDETNVYIITEFCPGSTLFSHIQDNYPTGLAEGQARPIFLSLVQAVSFLHLNDILHRDLKLTNVLLTETLQLRISDFGLATKLEDATSDQEMTMCGTPNYISPEIVKRDPYGLASDVWSLGCMLVALLTGRPPFQGSQISETLQLVARGQYRPLPRGASRDVKNLVQSILQVDPKRRPTTAEILAHPWLVSAVVQHDPSKSPLSDSLLDRSPPARGRSNRHLARPSPATNLLPHQNTAKSRRIPLLNIAKKITPRCHANVAISEAADPTFRFGESVENDANDPWRRQQPGTGYQELVKDLRGVRPTRDQAVRFQDDYRNTEPHAATKFEVRDEAETVSITSTDAVGRYRKHQQMVPHLEPNRFAEAPTIYNDQHDVPAPDKWTVRPTHDPSLAQYRSDQRLPGLQESVWQPQLTHARQWSQPLELRQSTTLPVRKYSASDALDHYRNPTLRDVKEQRQGYNQQAAAQTYHDLAQEARYSYASSGRGPEMQANLYRGASVRRDAERPESIKSAEPDQPHAQALFAPRTEKTESAENTRTLAAAANTRFTFPAAAPTQTAPQTNTNVDLVSLVNNIVERDDAAEKHTRNCSESSSTRSSKDDGSHDIVEKYKFSTVDLKSSSQKTKHGEVAILESGKVSVSLRKDARTHLISGDGETITVIDTSGREKHYPLADLPARSLFAYRFASKYVNLVRDKSVKIALDSVVAKCRLYHNDNFEVVLLKQERKISFLPATRGIKVASHSEVLWKGHLDQVEPGIRELVRQALVWWARCKDALNEPLPSSSLSRDFSELQLNCDIATTPKTTAPTDNDNQKVTARFIDGHGWCEKRAMGKLWVLFFLDGVSMELHTDSRTVKITDTENIVADYKLESGLPEPVRKRLKIASRAMKLFV